MRLVLLTLFIVAVVSATAALKPEVVENPQGYVNAVSKRFAQGDNSDASGWRECAEMESNRQGVGYVCEGTRARFHDGMQIDVNYFCEFHFARIDDRWARVDHELCQ